MCLACLHFIRGGRGLHTGHNCPPEAGHAGAQILILFQVFPHSMYVMEVTSKTSLATPDFTPVAIMPLSHFLGGLSHILDVACGTGDHIDHPPGKTVVCSCDVVLSASC